MARRSSAPPTFTRRTCLRPPGPSAPPARSLSSRSPTAGERSAVPSVTSVVANTVNPGVTLPDRPHSARALTNTQTRYVLSLDGYVLGFVEDNGLSRRRRARLPALPSEYLRARDARPRSSPTRRRRPTCRRTRPAPACARAERPGDDPRLAEPPRETRLRLRAVAEDAAPASATIRRSGSRSSEERPASTSRPSPTPERPARDSAAPTKRPTHRPPLADRADRLGATRPLQAQITALTRLRGGAQNEQGHLRQSARRGEGDARDDENRADGRRQRRAGERPTSPTRRCSCGRSS